MGLSRREALKAMIAASGATLATALATEKAEAAVAAPPDALGMLYDATVCTGCKSCMVACNQANDLAPDTTLSGGQWQMPLDLNEHTKNIIKLYEGPEPGGDSYIKRQCMHCLDPACANACMLGALQKREYGIVTYDANYCIGCRYCEMACPYNVIKFEWSKVIPKMVKCELCHHRIAQGKGPACCEVCPTGAVIYGKRSDLLAEAHRRLAAHPDRYVPKVYGEFDAGGTQVLYLAHVDFEKLGLPDYGDHGVPETVRNVQHTVYKGFVAPVALYGLLAAVVLRNRNKAGAAESEEDRP
ncbi:MAG TPA: hydrogenase 2 operon protein HybA [Candidatus Kryptonia bacterium]|nr:hydrogenase 2 operon protein HybA [Candidatus Kryptonia bacterium]